MFHAVRRDSKVQAFCADSLGQFTDDIAVRSHLHRGPVAKAAVVHGKAIVVLSNRDHILCP